MKKTILLLTILLLISCFSSCTTVKKDVNLSQDRADVKTIEIYHSESAYYEGDIHTFLDENEPIVILEPAQHSRFLDALCTLGFEEEVVFFPIPMDGGYDYEGYIVVVIYSDVALFSTQKLLTQKSPVNFQLQSYYKILKNHTIKENFC